MSYDFIGMTDLELVKLQAEIRKSPFPEDKEFLNAVLKELGKRQRERENKSSAPDVARLLKNG